MSTEIQVSKSDNCRCGLLTLEPDGVCMKCKEKVAALDYSLLSAPQPAQLLPGHRYCGGCGKLFKPAPHNHVYCSDDCRPRKAGKKEPRPCKRCGQAFVPNTGNKVYCSPSCARASRLESSALLRHARRSISRSRRQGPVE